MRRNNMVRSPFVNSVTAGVIFLGSLLTGCNNKAPEAKGDNTPQAVKDCRGNGSPACDAARNNYAHQGHEHTK